MRSLRFAALAVVVFTVAALGGRAYAYWTATGTGSTTVAVPELDAPVGPQVPAGAVATATPLVPGGDGDLVLVLQNPNPYPVAVTSVGPGVEPPESNAAGCSGTDALSLNPIVLPVPAPVLPADSGQVTLRFAAAVHMDAHAASACQGAAFTIPVRVEVTR